MASDRLAAAALSIAAFFLVGCSTIADRREDPPDLAQTTDRTIAEFRACFLPQFDKSSYPVSYVPTATGESYSWGASAGVAGRYVSWVVDIEDQGTKRKVTLHAIHSIGGPDRKIAAKVEACL
jgi:hypothetical protein